MARVYAVGGLGPDADLALAPVAETVLAQPDAVTSSLPWLEYSLRQQQLSSGITAREGYDSTKQLTNVNAYSARPSAVVLSVSS